jgi:PIN domain nuclease of toxin-antitoxin system
MRLLLDTHVFLWWISDDERVSRRGRKLIADPDNEIFFSVASAWELAIKAGLGRLELPDNPDRFIPKQLAENAFQPLPIQLRHALKVHSLPDLHRDPFDRMLVAQALCEDLAILSADRKMADYRVKVVW